MCVRSFTSIKVIEGVEMDRRRDENSAHVNDENVSKLVSRKKVLLSAELAFSRNRRIPKASKCSNTNASFSPAIN